MKIKTMYIAFALFALAALSVPAYAANPQLITSASALQDWLPLAFLAVVVGLMINAIYYVVASIINNKRAKSTAVAELWQSIASAVFVIVIIGVITLVGTSAISFTSILSQSSLTSLCAHLSGSQLSIVNPSYAPTFDICSQINSSLSSLTTSVDYGLISSYMIVANLTNQSATNLNSLYVYSGWIGFLTDFQARTYVCWPSACLAPGAALGEINTSYSPLAGYEDISNFIKPVQLEAGLSFYLLAMQLILITFFLYAWPYLLAAGIILRASFFTRSLGGLLMAISLSALLIFPVMYMIEYSAFTNLSLGPIGTSNSIPAIQTMALYEQQPNGTVSVYGSNSFGGYTNLNNLVGQPGNHAECLPSGVRTQYVYESQCGNPATAGVCTSRLPAGAQLCPTSGYVPALQASNSGCSPSQYAYESTCGDPNSVSSNYYHYHEHRWRRASMFLLASRLADVRGSSSLQCELLRAAAR
ncbi:MAG: hypothetical protein M1286_01160 [Candidatus Marsarchaeota archaeon]|nr:hypothetical protein [Candidatus Marsarchaeota archaeon]